MSLLTMNDFWDNSAVHILGTLDDKIGLNRRMNETLEAMASGVAVVAADAAGFPESIVHGRTGVLVPPHDARGFALEVVRLCLDPERRHLLGAAARRFAETRDSAAEDDDLLAQYAVVARLRAPRNAPGWSAGREGAAA